MEQEKDEEVIISLPVKKSSISSVDGGIARLHTSHMDMFEDEESHMVIVRYGKKDKVVRLVSDRFAPKNVIILRQGDMEDLEVDEGDAVDIEPYHKLKDELKETWEKFASRFRKKDEDEEEKGD
ncbi:MAG: hypothetical protein ACMUHM_00685 [Thermoplasmatota archaeon]